MAEGQTSKKGFSALFWLVIIFEFFERGSYYGVMSILSVYLTDILHFSKTSVGTIKATIQPILYFLPIISGALADRFGYRRAFLVAFTLLGSGYFITSGMSTYVAVFLALCFMALGAGTFKPLVTGTIAKVTDKSNSTIGFGIYYWTINLGAFLVPLILVPYLKTIPGNLPWQWVLIAAGIGTGILIIPTLLFYKEPPAEKNAEEQEFNLVKTLANAFEIIYSPFVLIFGYMRRSFGITMIVIFVTALALIYSATEFFGYHPVSEKLNVLPRKFGTGMLAIKVDRDMSPKIGYYSIIPKHSVTIGPKQITVAVAVDTTAPAPFELTSDSRGLTITVCSIEKSLGYLPELRQQVSTLTGRAISDSELVTMIENIITNENNHIDITFYKPDYYTRFDQELLQYLNKNPNFAELTTEELRQWINLANKKVSLIIIPAKHLGTDFRITKIKEDRTVIVELANASLSPEIRTRLLAELVKYEELSLLTAEQLASTVASMHKSSFLLPFMVILFIASLGILLVEKKFKTGTRLSKAGYLLGTVVILLAITWLLPNLSLFTRILTSVIFLTLLSLFLIDYDDLTKFKDHWYFLLMIFIYSGFWILYFQMFDSVLWYVKAYVDASGLNNAINNTLGFLGIHYRWFFDIEHVTVINAGTIILLQLLISKIVKNTRALPTMIVGILFGTIGMAILALSPGIWVFMTGIIIFSIGEMTAHPKFYSYVGQTAPRNRVAMYMGYIFLYGVIGASIGATIGANLYVRYVDNSNQPRKLWLIFSGIGVITIVGLVLYNLLIKKEEAGSHKA